MDNNRYIVQVFVGSVSPKYEVLSVEASKPTTADEIVGCISEKLELRKPDNYELAEVIGNAGGQECKERRLGGHENPVAVQLLWPKYLPMSNGEARRESFQAPEYRFCLREKLNDLASRNAAWPDGTDTQLIRDYFLRFLYQPRDKEYPDLCQLPDLNETTLLENLKARFHSSHIYTYVGSILIAVNPFKFYPIYNPKYVKLYQNRRLGELPPHIFAIADAAYHTMLRDHRNQCIVISGESGSGKTESTNFLLHHLTALSQKGTHGSGVEQTILSAGPVLEAFGNAKTAHNNNSSRFGKFIQVNYKENGMVHGAIVQKYLLEKSRIVSQAKQERNYHVFYYLLAGASEAEKAALNLGKPQDYHYLNQSNCYTLEGVDEAYEFLRLKQSMEMVGFSLEKQKRLFAVLSAVLHLGNIEFVKKSTYHHDEAVWVKNAELVSLISGLLRVKEETLMSALTCKRARASGEMLIINYKLPEAIAARDALAKCLYGALFDWIVLQVNHALLAKKDTTRDHHGYSIGVLDIFGFEDFGRSNSFEQFCINFANEHLQFYFNQHVFKYEQEEYKREGIRWKNIDFIDNTGCLQLIEMKPNGLICILDDQCNFPGATNETLLQKFHNEHKENNFYEVPQKRENAFIIKHYAGKVKYQVKDFREKNLDLMRLDIVSVLKNSNMAFVRELVGADPVAVFRWAIIRAFFRAYFAFIQAGSRHRNAEGGGDRGLKKTVAFRSRKCNENMMSPTRSPSRKINQNRRPLSNLHRNSSPDLMQTVNNSLHGYRTSLHDSCILFESTPRLNVNEARVLQRANRILQKNKSFKPKGRNSKSFKNLQSVKTLVGKTQNIQCPLGRATRKQPLTVSAQFQVSLNQLMETLNQASPFFVRCIKSNADKIPNRFDEEIILRQLRYTGMLETVRIRQSGYNVRLTFEEFNEHYRILLPKGLSSSQADVNVFLLRMNLNRDNYQIGKTKIFMRESEKLKLDYRLHQAILARIVQIQRWYRTILERRAFLRFRFAAIRIQSYVRRFLAQKMLSTLKLRNDAATFIQKCWRGYIARKRYLQLRAGIIFVQSCIRGYRVRERYHQMLQERRTHRHQLKSANDIAETQSQNDEAFLSKESSQEELENDHLYHPLNLREHRDSEESSGIQEDSEAESMLLDSLQPQTLTSVTPPTSPTSSQDSPLSPVPPNHIISDQIQKDVKLKDKFHLSQHEDKKNKLHKKLSIKRSKSAKATLSSEIPQFVIKHKQDKNLPPRRLSPELDRSLAFRRDSKEQKEPRDVVIDSKSLEQSSHKSAFHKAKKHLKTFIVLGKKRTINHGEDSDDSGSEDISVMTPRDSFDAPAETPDEAISVLQKFEELNKDSLEYEKEKKMSAIHHFKTSNKFSRGELCASCEKAMQSFLIHGGYRCTDCRQAFHLKCVHDAHKRPCQVVQLRRSNSIHQAQRPTITRIDNPNTNWNVTRMSEFTDRTDQIVSDVKELKNMDTFIFKKICQINEDGGKRDTLVDVVFKRALKEFKSNLISTYSVAIQDGNLSIKYKDLIANFEQIMEKICRQEKTTATFPITLGVNAFRGFLDEFMVHNRLEEKVKTKSKKEKRKKELVAHQMGHSFASAVMNIPTICEICSSFMWLMEKGLVCQNCKLTCHKKCYHRVVSNCKEEQEGFFPEGKVFAVPLSRLIPEDAKIPPFVDRLITTIEMKGLYTEGIYRKSGASTKVRMLRQSIENDLENVNFDAFAIHVLTSTLKCFLRELPEPLMTYERYDDFIRATDVSDAQDRIITLFSIINKLPKPNFDLTERLIFHLARVAQQEEFNRMSPNALAIVFAPCILRTNKKVNAQDSLNDVNKQTLCLEYIIHEQLRKVKSTLADIDTLDSACHTATSRLSTIRSSKVNLPKMYLPPESPETEIASEEGGDDEEMILTQQIESLQHEKALLTTELPTLIRTSSDDDMLSTDVDSTAGSLDDIQHPQYEEYALTFDLPVSPSSLQHLTKSRAPPPGNRKLPSRFSMTEPKLINFGDKRNHLIPADTSIVSIYPPIDIEYKDDAIMV